MKTRLIGILCVVGALVSSMSMIGCSSGGTGEVDPALRDEGRAVFGGGGAGGQEGPASGDTAPTPDGEEGWAVLLELVRGPDHESRAQVRRRAWATQLGRGDVTVRERDAGSAVVLGSYDEPDDARAQRDLRMVKALEVNGVRPFAGAYLLPPTAPEPEMGERPEWNLMRVAEMPAGRNALYSLHVGVFEGRNRERRAEEECERLRRLGEQAYYFHGRDRSAVTVGLFGEDAYGRRGVSGDVRALQARFAYMMLNGRERLERADGSPEPTILVQIPR